VARKREFATPKAIVRRSHLAKALNLRVQGKSYAAIAEECGYETEREARRQVTQALRTSVVEPTEEVRAIELHRLDVILERAEEIFVKAGNDDRPEFQFRALDMMLKVQERRAKYLGLDAPRVVDIFKTTLNMGIADGLTREEATAAAKSVLEALNEQRGLQGLPAPFVDAFDDEWREADPEP